MFSLVTLLAVQCLGIQGTPLNDPSRIVGGELAPEGYAPHMAALINRNNFGDHLVCGGSIVTRRNILTAAHCVTPFVDFSGRLSPSFMSRVGSNEWERGGVIATFENHHIHPKYDFFFIKYDVAVLKLESKLHFNENVSPIGLNFEFVGGGEHSYVTGWGRTGPVIEDNVVSLAPIPDQLQLLYLWTISPQECEDAMSVAFFPPIESHVEICTFHSVGHGMCHGDSGSALVTLNSGLQCGIVSWGSPCAVGFPDVYVRLSGVRDFVEPLLERDDDEEKNNV